MWVNFTRAGKMVKMLYYSFFWRAAVIFSAFLNCSEEILSVRF